MSCSVAFLLLVLLLAVFDSYPVAFLYHSYTAFSFSLLRTRLLPFAFYVLCLIRLLCSRLFRLFFFFLPIFVYLYSFVCVLILHKYPRCFCLFILLGFFSVSAFCSITLAFLFALCSFCFFLFLQTILSLCSSIIATSPSALLLLRHKSIFVDILQYSLIHSLIHTQHHSSRRTYLAHRTYKALADPTRLKVY